ncbi:hypothetical protein HXX76_009196 [Chlamydomonas incerta]|uniref:Uncharacterized protein n=1 Tax=Chlamydomonas incerta TaxID=51695 RepID=A0A835SSE5_CHLIN|nr:hypothetical protein HXX76_009196 [Chlamydomonas incerta]|eukprot:KAG2432278.1 hypothetical protein HXX76_009196 [Chlamydomonas incerta]
MCKKLPHAPPPATCGVATPAPPSQGIQAPIATRYARSVLSARHLDSHPYLCLLRARAPLAWFRSGHREFLAAVNGWSNLLGLLLSRLPRPEQRLPVIANLYDEHGGGNLGASHVATFSHLLSIMADDAAADTTAAPTSGSESGIPGSSIVPDLDLPPHPAVDRFLEAFRSTGSWAELAGALGMVEFSYAFVSAAIADYCSHMGLAHNRHYATHQDLDLDHADALFALVEPLLAAAEAGEEEEAAGEGKEGQEAAAGGQGEQGKGMAASRRSSEGAGGSSASDCGSDEPAPAGTTTAAAATAAAAAAAARAGMRLGHGALMDLYDAIRREAAAEAAEAAPEAPPQPLLRVALIASAGCTALSVLGDGPLAGLDCVDANPEQLALTRLKLAAAAHYAAQAAAEAEEAAPAAAAAAAGEEVEGADSTAAADVTGGVDAAAQRRYLAFLRGRAPPGEVDAVLAAAAASTVPVSGAAAAAADAASYWAPGGGCSAGGGGGRRRHLLDGAAGMGKYEHIFRKLAAVAAALPAASGGDAAAFAAAFGDATLERQYGPLVAAHACRPLTEGFAALLRPRPSDCGVAATAAATAADEGQGQVGSAAGGGVNGLPRNAYFQALVDGAATAAATPPPPYATRLTAVAAGLAATPVRLAAAGMAEFLEAAAAAANDGTGCGGCGGYDLIQASNVTDWMSEEQAARLLRAARAALRPGGRLLLRRIWGRFQVEDLRAHGFSLVRAHQDASGLYTQVAEFAPTPEPSSQELRAFEAALAAGSGGGAATYPLGSHVRFRIDHGPDYLRFFRRMGEVRYFTARDPTPPGNTGSTGSTGSSTGPGGSTGPVVATLAAVLRPIPGAAAPSAPSPSAASASASTPSSSCWYLGDLRVAPAHRGGRLPAAMVARDLPALLRRSPRAFAVEMLPAAGAPGRIERLFRHVLAPPPAAAAAAAAGDGSVAAAAAGLGGLVVRSTEIEIWALDAAAARRHWPAIAASAAGGDNAGGSAASAGSSCGGGGGGGVTLLDLGGVKDLIRVPHQTPLRVLHVIRADRVNIGCSSSGGSSSGGSSSGCSSGGGDVTVAEPEDGALHMVCCRARSGLSAALRRQAAGGCEGGGAGGSSTAASIAAAAAAAEPLAHARVVHVGLDHVDWGCLSTAEI